MAMELLETQPEIQEGAAQTETQDSTAISDDTSGAAPAHIPPGTRDDAISKALDEAEGKNKPDEADDADDDDDADADEKSAKNEKTKAENPAKEQDADDGAEDDDNADDAEGDDPDGDDDEAKTAKKEKPKRPTIPAPDKFLPEAKEHWKSVPHAVRSDIQRIIGEYEGAAEHSRAAVERYNSIQEYDEIARSNGVDLKDTLAEVKALEDMMQANPMAAINNILLRSGPRKADGQPVSLYEMATAIVQMGPEGYQRAMTQHQQQQQMQQQQQQPNPEVEALRAEMQQMKIEQMRDAVIGPFVKEHPRYQEKAIQSSIASLLKSGMVPDSLPANERLAVAYDMAVRLNPSSDDEYTEVEAEKAKKGRVDGSGNSKSIRGAPPSGVNKGASKRVLSRDDAIKAAMSALR